MEQAHEDAEVASPDSSAGSGRFHTTVAIKRLVWVRSAGHCELCGQDLTRDFRIGQEMAWGEVAHIMPASPKGPRADSSHGAQEAADLTNDTNNLMLLCPGCHDRVDRDADCYPTSDLTELHQAFQERIRLAASVPDAGRAIGLIVQGSNFVTNADISQRDLAMAMSSEGLSAFGDIIKITLKPPGADGRDDRYWANIKDEVRHHLERQLERRGGRYGDQPALAVVGLADIPALIMLGQTIGDRSNRVMFSKCRDNGLRWPDPSAAPPDYQLHIPDDGAEPIALAVSISAKIPERDVLLAVPSARIATLTIEDPRYSIVSNRGAISAFRDALQRLMSHLEASSPDPIHLFIAAPAAFCIELGALMTTEHQHPYVVYDREKTQHGRFVKAFTITTGDRA